mgnify:CR=1 FL=1
MGFPFSLLGTGGFPFSLGILPLLPSCYPALAGFIGIFHYIEKTVLLSGHFGHAPIQGLPILGEPSILVYTAIAGVPLILVGAP